MTDYSDEVLTTLRKILRAISLRSKRLVQECGLTTPQLMILRAIGSFGEVSVGILSKEVSLSQATVTSILDRLVARGLVVRTRSESDRRKVILTLSSEGRERLAGAPRPLQEEFVQSFSHLPDWEQTLILSSLQRVASMMDAKKISAGPLLTGEDLT